jgi:amino acid adenylation domain-containing protein
LGEIETRLAAHDNVKEAVVIDRKAPDGVSYLCAYVVPVRGDFFDPAQLTGRLAEKLPAYMVPAHVVQLEEIPLTLNGKVDRKALPEPVATVEIRSVAPRNELEKRLAQTWSNVLGVDSGLIGIDSDFFRTGGHSLNATRLVAQVNREFNLELPLVKIFELPRLKDFAAYLAKMINQTGNKKQTAAQIEPVEQKEYYALSPAQKRLWIISQQQEASLTLNMPSAYSLEGPLDIPALEKALAGLVKRHESLGTVFITVNGQPKQRIVPDMAFHIQRLDLQEEKSEPARQRQVQQAVDAEYQTLFDLNTGPLLRVKLLVLGPSRFVLLLTMHHIVSDGISMQVLFKELFMLYGGMKTGNAGPLEPLRLQYKDYAQWQNSILEGERLEKLKRRWAERLSAPLPILQLPTDHPRPDVLGFNGDEYSFLIDEPLTRQLRTTADRHDATLFMVLLTAFTALLSRYSGQTDIITGIPIAGREHADLYGQIGFFLNALPLRARFNADDSLAGLMQNVKQVCLEAYEHQQYPFDRLVDDLGIRRHAGHSPVFDVMLDMINAESNAAAKTGDSREDFLRDLTIQPLKSSQVNSKYDITLYVFEGTGGLGCKFEYNRDLFEKPTIQRMAGRFQALLEQMVENPARTISELELGGSPVFSPIEPVSTGKETDAPLPASYHQERLWFIDEFEAGNLYPANPVYHNLPLLLRIEGPLDVELLEKSIQMVIQRHRALRTRIIERDNRPCQFIGSEVTFQLAVKDVVSSHGDHSPASLLEAALEETRRPLPLDRESLLRGVLVKGKGDCQHLLALTVHHIAADRRSLRIIAGELLSHYRELLEGSPGSIAGQTGEAPLHYGDFSRWQRALTGEQREALLLYWKWALRGKLMALELPTDRPRAHIHIYKSGWYPFTFSDGLNEKIAAFMGNNQTKPFPLLLAVFKTLLHRYCGQDEIVVGTAMENGTRPEAGTIVGPIDNLVVLRGFIHEGMTFRQLLAQLEKTITGAETYRAMPFDQLVLELKPDVDMSRTALFDVLFQYEDQPVLLPGVDNLEIEVIETNLGLGKYDLNMLVQNKGDGFSGVLVYNREYHDQSFISRFIDHFMALMDQAFDRPGEQLSRLDLLTRDEHCRLLFEWNQVRVDYPRDKTLHQVSREQAERWPGKIALSGVGANSEHEIQITYAQLNRMSDALALRLEQKGIRTGDIVALLTERSIEMIIGILAILKAGAAYLPLDPEYPKERIDYMINDSGASLLLASEGMQNADNSLFINNRTLSEAPAPRMERPGELAYIIYTSGTTGLPKGCMISHRNVLSLLKNKTQSFDFSEADVWTMFHRYNFDFSVWEMYGALLYGGKLIVIPSMATRDPGQYLEILKQQRVTVLNQTPPAFYHLAEAEIAQPDRRLVLRYIIFGGEALSPGRLKAFKTKYPNIKLINMFGITETTIHVTYKEIGFEEIEAGASNIGKPVPTLSVYVIDRNLNLSPIGVPGELLVAGEGVATGYLNRPDLTSERFINAEMLPNGPLNKSFLRGVQGGRFFQKKPPLAAGGNLYKSGDLVKWLENGDMEYLGRIDHQVKIRGFRIELGEIESRLREHETIKEAVVICERGDKTLCACIVPAPGSQPDAAVLRARLASVLPDYMVPSSFKQLERIPLTANGKVDRKALEGLGSRLETSGGVSHAAPVTDMETRVAAIWKEVLKTENRDPVIGIDDNFFDIGGNSMDVVQVKAKIAAELGRDLPIVDLYQYTTIRDLAGFLDRGESVQPDDPPESNRAERIEKARTDKNKMRDRRKRGRK